MTFNVAAQRVSAVCTVALALVSIAADDNRPNRVADPSDPVAQDWRDAATPPPQDGLTTRGRLHDYAVGSPFHPGVDAFCEMVAEKVATQRKRAGRNVRMILLRGHADGLPNRGITRYKKEEFPRACRDTFMPPISDESLAALRACIVREKLLLELGPDYTTAAMWRTDKRDVPDGGSVGGAWRSVDVEITFAE